MTHIRRRGTAIVETENGILVAAGSSKVFLLPGGSARRHESRTKAALRELREETGLFADSYKFLFRHRGYENKSYRGGFFRDHHTVLLVKAYGKVRPSHEIRYIDYYSPNSRIKLSTTTKEIIEKYYRIKKQSKEKGILRKLFAWVR